MKSFVLGFAVLLLSVAGTACGQHADIRPYVADGRILTAGFNDATSTEVLDMRVFGYDFGEDPGQPFFAQDPGFNAAAGSGLLGGEPTAV